MLVFEDRPSDSPFIERIWTSRSERAGEFLSVAQGHFEMVVTRYRGEAFLTMRGPETRVSLANCPADAEWVALRFKLGTFFPKLLPGRLKDRQDVTLAAAGTRSFWLDGSAWEYPTYDNLDTFASRLVRKGLIGRDTAIEAVLRGDTPRLSVRATQRHFARATGITFAAFRSIERARYATNLLRQGMPTLDVVHAAGYFDQPHLTRSLKRLIGQTPSAIAARTRQLSFLYKTTPDG
jgi:hypothetical protein